MSEITNSQQSKRVYLKVKPRKSNNISLQKFKDIYLSQENSNKISNDSENDQEQQNQNDNQISRNQKKMNYKKVKKSKCININDLVNPIINNNEFIRSFTPVKASKRSVISKNDINLFLINNNNNDDDDGDDNQSDNYQIDQFQGTQENSNSNFSQNKYFSKRKYSNNYYQNHEDSQNFKLWQELQQLREQTQSPFKSLQKYYVQQKNVNINDNENSRFYNFMQRKNYPQIQEVQGNNNDTLYIQKRKVSSDFSTLNLGNQTQIQQLNQNQNSKDLLTKIQDKQGGYNFNNENSNTQHFISVFVGQDQDQQCSTEIQKNQNDKQQDINNERRNQITKQKMIIEKEGEDENETKGKKYFSCLFQNNAYNKVLQSQENIETKKKYEDDLIFNQNQYQEQLLNQGLDDCQTNKFKNNSFYNSIQNQNSKTINQFQYANQEEQNTDKQKYNQVFGLSKKYSFQNKEQNQKELEEKIKLKEQQANQGGATTVQINKASQNPLFNNVFDSRQIVKKSNKRLEF